MRIQMGIMGGPQSDVCMRHLKVAAGADFKFLMTADKALE